jgi:hypothetical protein
MHYKRTPGALKSKTNLGNITVRGRAPARWHSMDERRVDPLSSPRRSAPFRCLRRSQGVLTSVRPEA